jgi:hypothetical protein
MCVKRTCRNEKNLSKCGVIYDELTNTFSLFACDITISLSLTFPCYEKFIQLCLALRVAILYFHVFSSPQTVKCIEFPAFPWCESYEREFMFKQSQMQIKKKKKKKIKKNKIKCQQHVAFPSGHPSKY